MTDHLAHPLADLTVCLEAETGAFAAPVEVVGVCSPS